VIVGFDISTSLGWAITRLDDEDRVVLIEHGVCELPTKMNPIDKLDRLRVLFDTLEMHAVECIAGVYVEGIPFVKQAQAHASYWRVRTMVEVVAAERDCYPVTEVNASTLKKWATGKGNADKALMCRAARERFGVRLHARKGDEQKGSKGQEDEADAILVAAWAHS